MKKPFRYLFVFFLIIGGAVFYKYKIQSPKNDPFIKIPLYKLEHSNFYYLNIDVENHTIPVVLDTGFSTPFALHKDFLDIIQNKKDEGKYLKTVDINGNRYKKKSYFIDAIKIENSITVEADTEEDDPFLHTYGSSIQNPNTPSTGEISQAKQEWLNRKMGIMGFKVLKSLDCWCIDFPNSKMYAITNWEHFLKRFNLSSANLLEIPLLGNKQEIIMSVDTDFGTKDFMLDTAATGVLMRCPFEESLEHTTVSSSKFEINKHNFKEQEIYFFNFPESFHFDGILGMSFLKNKTLLFDFKNNKMFIKSTGEKP